MLNRSSHCPGKFYVFCSKNRINCPIPEEGVGMFNQCPSVVHHQGFQTQCTHTSLVCHSIKEELHIVSLYCPVGKGTANQVLGAWNKEAEQTAVFRVREAAVAAVPNCQVRVCSAALICTLGYALRVLWWGAAVVTVCNCEVRALQ